MSDIEKNNVEDDINLILESIISGEELDNSDNLLETINNSNQNFSNINMQLENIIDKYSSVGDIAFGYIANALKSTASDHILGIAEDIYDTNLKKYQSEINSELLNKNFDDKYAPKTHDHNYAGSSSVGGAATSSNKLNKITGSTPATAATFGTSVTYYTLVGTTADENNKRYAGDNTGFPVTSNANGLLWLGNHTNSTDSRAIGYGSQLGFSSDGNIYYRFITNGTMPTTANGGSWKKLSYDGHTHDSAYLRLSGGEMTGDIKSTNIYPTITNSYTLGRTQRVQYKNVYSKEFTEDGVSLATKYAPKTHEHDNVYKPLQTPVTEPADDISPATMFINSITQDENGVITAVKKTVPTMTGASSSADGSIGLVPVPVAGQQTSFLRGDGNWATPTDNKVAYDAKSDNASHPILFANNTSSIGSPSIGSVCYESNSTNGSGLTYNPSSNIMRFPVGSKLTTGTADTSGNGLTAKLKTIYALTSSLSSETTYGVGSTGQMLKSNGTSIYWDTQANATTSADGFMSAEDKTKLDKIQDYYEVLIDTSSWEDGSVGSMPTFRCFDYDISEFNFKIGDKIRLKSNTDFPQNTSIRPSKYIVNDIVVTNPNNDFSFSIQPDTNNAYGNAITQNLNMWNLSKYGGYIDIIVTKPYLENGEVGCQCVPLYNNELGFNSYYSTDAINAKKVNILATSSSASYPLVFTNNVTAGNKSLYTDSVNSLHYNPSTDILTASCISVKTTGVAAEGIRLTGGTAKTAPSISIKTAGSLVEGIKLTGRGTSNNTYTAAEIKVAGGPTGTHTTITGGSSPVTSSDERLKNFKNDVEVDFDKLKQIPKKYFTWKDGDQTKLEMGTSAQEVEKLYPNIVQEIDGYKSLEYSKLSIIALAAIDKLNERITELENKLKEYEQA